MPPRESKPTWSKVPIPVRREAERRLGAPVVRATRAFGGFGPSATFSLVLADRRRAFFKAGYPLPKSSPVVFPIDGEAKRYRALAGVVGRWMPRQYGSFRRDGWHVLLMEDLGPEKIPSWSPRATRVAARSYARFHLRTTGRRLPAWLSRTQHQRFGSYWKTLDEIRDLGGTASLARARADEACEWLDVALPVFRERERMLIGARTPFALLHGDTRSDNIRIAGDRMVMFDWPFASVGPAEFDVAAFAQAVAAERGPSPERVLAWYEELYPLRERELDGSLAGICGYFAHRAWQPDLPGLPRLRSIQRRQLKASLSWAARRFGLPEPRWLAAVKD